MAPNIFPASNNETQPLSVLANSVRLSYGSTFATSRIGRYVAEVSALPNVANVRGELRHCAVIFDTWPSEKRDAILDFFLKTVRFNSSKESEHLYLF